MDPVISDPLILTEAVSSQLFIFSGSYQCECESGYVLADDGHNCKEGGCNLQLNDPEGEITSPNYPFDYPKGKNCNWHFVTTPGHRLSLVSCL